jgi:hypothetical protein
MIKNVKIPEVLLNKGFYYFYFSQFKAKKIDCHFRQSIRFFVKLNYKLLLILFAKLINSSGVRLTLF